MPIYSNSPLGLVLYSDTNNSGSNVGKYISATGSNKGLSSLFSRKNSTNFKFTPDPNTSYNSDISTESIIEYTQKIQSMSLKYSDFAYLKNLGVYPNNRLVIARRFNAPVSDDLTSIKNPVPIPVSTLVSWIPDNTEFISTEFGEEWDNSEASFRGILNDLGKDVMGGDNKGKNLGDFLAGGAGVIPLPGFTEGLQYEVFKQLGMTDLDASQLPIGNPNLIRESKRRKTLDKENAGSGLKCKFKVEMTVEYEQKFINGVDPTLVYYDIIANALTFGSSEAQFQFKGGKNVDDFSRFIDNLGSGDSTRVKQALGQFIAAISNAVSKIANTLIDMLKRTGSSIKNSLTGDDKTQADKVESAKASQKEREEAEKKMNSYNVIKEGLLKTVQGLVSKYKIRIIGVVNSLTGTPSTPWHVTIGNPRRPIFSSGDMLVEEVKISMGKVLAFNDLPSSIKLTFTLTSARNLGTQEIFKKFNCGKERTYYKLQKAFVETDFEFKDTDIVAAQTTLTTNQVNKPVVNSSNKDDQKDSSLKAKELFDTNAPGFGKLGMTFNTDADGYGYGTIPTTSLPDSIKADFVGATTMKVDAKTGRVYGIYDKDPKERMVGNWSTDGNKVTMNLRNSKKTTIDPNGILSK